MRPWTRRTLFALAVPTAAVAVLAVEGAIAANREFLPNDTGYLIDQTVGEGDGAPLELVVLGDSTTAGVGSPTEDTSLPYLVATRVAAELGRPVHVISIGISGAKTGDVLDIQVPLLADLRADVVLVVAGANDTPRLTPPSRVEKQTRQVLSEAHRLTGAPVVLGGVPRFTEADALLQPLRWVVDSYGAPLRAAQRRAIDSVRAATYVDIAAEASPRFVGVPESMSTDQFHPTPLGYGYWADALAPVVARVAR